MSSTTKGLKRKQVDASSASELEIPAEKIRCRMLNILDLPNEILSKIILFMNARERVGLGNSCRRFNTLVFEDEVLLRNLDFSKDGHLTLASDVQQYFEDENFRNNIHRVNIRNTRCIKAGCMLNDSIGQAKNLVDINIHGVKFQDIWNLGSFLNPLQHVKRLSFDWSDPTEKRIPICCKFLQGPFSRLKYMSVRIEVLNCVKVFIPCLRLCQELEELHMVVKTSSETNYSDSWSGEPQELRNLEVLEYCGPLAMEMKERFIALLPNPEKWADFQMNTSPDLKGFYLAIVDVCEELAASKWIERIPDIALENRFNLGWAFIPELLLEEVLGITHENVPQKLCCLSKFKRKQRCLLKIDEAKRLIENPRSQISYLYMNHPLHLGCDVHLVASAFVNLTELRLAAITRHLSFLPMDSHYQKCLRKRGEAIPDEMDETLNMDSSFKMLVENTPYLRHFTLGGSGISYKNWSLDELRLISRWKYLETLRLLDIPIEDGEFLIDIGKRCENLQNLKLINLGTRFGRPMSNCCYEEGLLEMLTNCHNLRNFTIETTILKVISTMLSLLANNVLLSRLHIKSQYGSSDVLLHSGLVSSIEELLRQCSKLTTFVGEFDSLRKWNGEKLSLIQKRWKEELNRPHLQTRMCWKSSVSGTVLEDSPHSNPFPDMWITN